MGVLVEQWYGGGRLGWGVVEASWWAGLVGLIDWRYVVLDHIDGGIARRDAAHLGAVLHSVQLAGRLEAGVRRLEAAAPLTPLESPCRCFTSRVSTQSENTRAPHSFGTFT